MKTDN